MKDWKSLALDTLRGIWNSDNQEKREALEAAVAEGAKHQDESDFDKKVYLRALHRLALCYEYTEDWQNLHNCQLRIFHAEPDHRERLRVSTKLADTQQRLLLLDAAEGRLRDVLDCTKRAAKSERYHDEIRTAQLALARHYEFAARISAIRHQIAFAESRALSAEGAGFDELRPIIAEIHLRAGSAAAALSELSIVEAEKLAREAYQLVGRLSPPEPLSGAV